MTRVQSLSPAGISVVEQDFTQNWDFIQSVFFTTTILTTIGYGHIAPVTTLGILKYCNSRASRP